MFLSESTWAVLIGAIPTTIVSATGLVVALKSLQKVKETKEDVVDLKKNTDGMHTALMELNSRANFAEGAASGTAAEQARVLEQPQPVTPPVSEQLDKIEAAVTETKEVLAEQPAVRPAVRKQLDAIEKAVTDKEKQEN